MMRPCNKIIFYLIAGVGLLGASLNAPGSLDNAEIKPQAIEIKAFAIYTSEYGLRPKLLAISNIDKMEGFFYPVTLIDGSKARLDERMIGKLILLKDYEVLHLFNDAQLAKIKTQESELIKMVQDYPESGPTIYRYINTLKEAQNKYMNGDRLYNGIWATKSSDAAKSIKSGESLTLKNGNQVEIQEILSFKNDKVTVKQSGGISAILVSEIDLEKCSKDTKAKIETLKNNYQALVKSEKTEAESIDKTAHITLSPENVPTDARRDNIIEREAANTNKNTSKKSVENVTPKAKQEQFVDAANDCDLKKITELLSQFPGLSGCYCYTDALYFAVENKNKEMVKVLLDNAPGGVNPEPGMLLTIANRSNEYVTPLSIAAKNNDVEMMRLLLNYGADVKPLCLPGGRTYLPLVVAATNGNNNAVKLMLEECDINVNDCFDDLKVPILCRVVKENRIEIARTLLAHKANANITNTFSHVKPLVLAVGNRNLDMVKLLLENKADIKENSALHHAVVSNQLEIVRLLIDYKADVNYKCIDEEFNAFFAKGDTPLCAAAGYASEDILNLLLACKADVDFANGHNTPLLIAARKGNNVALRLFLEKGANVNAVDGKGNTALNLAAMNKNLAAAKLLLERQIDVNKANVEGYTPFYTAKRAGYTPMVDLLLKYGGHD